MKILLLGKGNSTLGCSRLLDSVKIKYDLLEINELVCYDYDLIVKSPGISLEDPVFNKLNGKVISDIELVYKIKKPFIIAVTGSNGKTTVVSMLEYILSKKYKAIACGNIGYSFADAVLDHPDYDYYILECSSFQLEAIEEFCPNIAVLLNIDLCHLDHHKTLANYVMAKLNIAKNLGKNCYFIHKKEIPYIKSKSNNEIIYSALNTSANIFVLGENIYNNSKPLFKVNNLFSHSVENIMAVLGVLKVLNELKLKNHIKSFKGVKYRLECVDKNIYNDAKSTNCASTDAALCSLDKVHLICGGFDRGIPIILSNKAISHIRMVYAYGQSNNKICEYFKNKNIYCLCYNDLKSAFYSAMYHKEKDEVVLYSPMFASFDQYKNYNQRGEEFDFLLKEYKKNP
ncbi:MAG: UDP-N-acetylmuramoyl-L-alanine--D-glutamate ligase [Anaeroplasma sp.]